MNSWQTWHYGKSMACWPLQINPVIAGEDLAIVHFNFANRVTAVLDANRVTEAEEVRSPAYGTMCIEGTGGKLRLGMDGSLYVAPRGTPEAKHDYLIPAGWKGGAANACQQHFVDCLKSGVPFEANGPDYLKSVRALFACYESAERNQVMNCPF